MILSIGLLYTSAMRLAFLGPVGTYGERAARRLAGRRGSICVAGSFYLAAEVRAQLLAPRDDLPGSQ